MANGMRDRNAKPRIAVVGSINLDLVLRCARFPKPGETIAAQSFGEVFGGKGANQAVSAARAGGQVAMIGRVGDDPYGDRLLGGLREAGVDCSSVARTSTCESGLAIINVDASGQNTIVIVAGANAHLVPEDIDALQPVIATSEVVLLQLEIPMETVRRVVELSRAHSTRIILDPAPAPRHFPEELFRVDLLCPNEQEAAQLSGLPAQTLPQIETCAQSLFDRGARHVVITMGGRGAFLYDEKGGRVIPPYPTEVVDTTAAGDAFAGALAVRWAECDDLEDAVRFGNAAGALAASKQGAQPSMAARSAIETLRGTLT